MAGFRTFATGEVLTAANVNNFLMKQSVMVFADAAARTTALGADVVEGMLTYNLDTDQLEVFDGSAFVVAAPAQNLVEVKSVLKTDTFTASVAAGANVAVTDLSLTHTLADAGNKLLITAMFGVAKSSAGHGEVGIAVAEDGTLIAIGDADGNRTRVTAGGVTSSGPDNLLNMSLCVSYVHAPGDTSAHTYTVRAINTQTNTRTLFVNRSDGDANDARNVRGASSLVIQEVRA